MLDILYTYARDEEIFKRMEYGGFIELCLEFLFGYDVLAPVHTSIAKNYCMHKR